MNRNPDRAPSLPTFETTVLAIPGMTCGSCVDHVHQALDELPGVRMVQVDRVRGQAHVVFEPAQVRVPRLVAALADAGYDASPMAA